MCFIKNSCLNSPVLLSDETFLPEAMGSFPSSKEYIRSSSCLQLCPSFSSIQQFLGSDSQLLGSLLAAINNNSNLLLKLQQNIDFSDKMLEEAAEVAADSLQEQTSSQGHLQIKTWRAKDQIIQKLFGEKQYKYRLKLRNKFPNTIYKERNISLGLELVDSNDKLVMNSNLANLCAAACEVNGNWITENEEGEYFIQGKTEVELYHGQAIFHKIYPRDVSRQFQNGKIDVVIYPKPSLIQFSSSASNVQERVKAQEIEPLLIKDITIRAKKKSQ